GRARVHLPNIGEAVGVEVRDAHASPGIRAPRVREVDGVPSDGGFAIRASGVAERCPAIGAAREEVWRAISVDVEDVVGGRTSRAEGDGLEAGLSLIVEVEVGELERVVEAGERRWAAAAELEDSDVRTTHDVLQAVAVDVEQDRDARAEPAWRGGRDAQDGRRNQLEGAIAVGARQVQAGLPGRPGT